MYELLVWKAALLRCSDKKVFLKYAANLQEITHAEVRGFSMGVLP